ncbi:DNA polymerase III subunit delta' [Acuticoccus sp.]|uniref:DNA polymerase III subunit delta' n=1 Tax=Acuticoccus sp. TaxID=1904378 RepID=UPI003B52A731
MARPPRAPRPAEGAPAEPDLIDNAPAPREATSLHGHEDAVARLAASFEGAAPQSILLEGPRGIGKATLAFRLARALAGSVPGTGLDPRLASDPNAPGSRQIAAGTHPGVLHLTRPWDDKQKRFKTELTVDEVRRIVPFLGATAAHGGWRIVIVDAVDDLNLNAANALLKALEEPPRRGLFVLIAHVSGRVLPTIRSRCRAVRLRPLPADAVARALTELGADPSLAKAGQGSVRRALVLAAAGADVVRSAARILEPRTLREARAQHQLADLAAQRRDDQFATVLELVLDAAADRARNGAGRLPLAALDAYAELYLAATDARRRVEVFNLDRKEMMLALTARLAAADRVAGLT